MQYILKKSYHDFSQSSLLIILIPLSPSLSLSLSVCYHRLPYRKPDPLEGLPNYILEELARKNLTFDDFRLSEYVRTTRRRNFCDEDSEIAPTKMADRKMAASSEKTSTRRTTSRSVSNRQHQNTMTTSCWLIDVHLSFLDISAL